jgi:hypothetical protein
VTSIGFATLAREVMAAARAAGATVPVSFRSPPSGDDVRTIRHRPDGSVVVAVRIAERCPAEVLGDLIDGTVAAQALPSPAAIAMASRLRDVLHDGG